jgi:uncharacterized membrane protein YfcA
MRTILGVSLAAAGVVMNFAGALLLIQVEADLLEKRPGLSKIIYGWWGFPDRVEIVRRYKSEFPNGHRVRNSMVCSIAGAIAFFAGIMVLFISK